MEQFDIIDIQGVQLYNYASSSDINISNAFTQMFFELYVNPLMDDNMFLYEIPEVRIEPNDIIIDCGGCFGLFSAWAAAHGKQVFCLEPSKNNLVFLQKTASLYNNIQVIPKATGEDKHIEEFIDCYFPCGSHFNKYNINQQSLIKDIISVEVIPLDDLFIGQIDFIKIDTEGAEIETLLGSQNIIKNYTPKLAIASYHLEQENKEIMNLLLSYNKDYKFKIKKDILFAWI